MSEADWQEELRALTADSRNYQTDQPQGMSLDLEFQDESTGGVGAHRLAARGAIAFCSVYRSCFSLHGAVVGKKNPICAWPAVRGFWFWGGLAGRGLDGGWLVRGLVDRVRRPRPVIFRGFGGHAFWTRLGLPGFFSQAEIGLGFF